MLFFAILYPPNSGKLLPNRKHPQAASAKKEMEQVLVLKTQEPMNQSELKRVTSKDTWTPPKMGIQSVAGQYTSISIGELLRLFPCEGQDRKSTSFVLGVLTIND